MCDMWQTEYLTHNPRGDLGGEGITQPANKSLLFAPTARVATHASTLIYAHYTILVSAQLDPCAAPTLTWFKYAM